MSLVEMLLLSGSSLPTSLSVCLIMASASAAPDLDSFFVMEAFPLVMSLFLHVIYGLSFLFQIIESGQGHQRGDGKTEAGGTRLLFQFHQQINEIKFKEDTIVWVLSVLIKKERKGALYVFVFHVFIYRIASAFL